MVWAPRHDWIRVDAVDAARGRCECRGAGSGRRGATDTALFDRLRGRGARRRAADRPRRTVPRTAFTWDSARTVSSPLFNLYKVYIYYYRNALHINKYIIVKCCFNYYH